MLQIGGKLDKDSPSCMLICSRKKMIYCFLNIAFNYSANVHIPMVIIS